jgi:hypothetical protein
MAGTGKSTVARTVAQRLHSHQRLAASFFFAKGGGDHGLGAKFFSTLAVQIAKRIPIFRKYLYRVLNEERGLLRKVALFEQYDKLIVRPLRMARHEGNLSSIVVVVVVDALDECDNQEDITLILRLLASPKDVTSFGMCIFVASRPETPVRLGFRDMDRILYQDLRLELAVPRFVIEHDIFVYLNHELSQIAHQRRLASNWPGEQHLRVHVEQSAGLFILLPQYVATSTVALESHLMKGYTS